MHENHEGYIKASPAGVNDTLLCVTDPNGWTMEALQGATSVPMSKSMCTQDKQAHKQGYGTQGKQRQTCLHTRYTTEAIVRRD